MDWNLVLKRHLQELIRIDTTNPPGGEIAAARYLAGVLAEAGIASEIFEPLPGRGSIVARLKGDGSQRPLMLLGHLDVVPAAAKDWRYNPFSGEEAEGAIWGRGAVDMKGLVAKWLTLVLKLKAEATPLKRDIIFAATADEEQGGHHGLGWIAANRPDLVDCEIALNEGGGNALTVGGRTYLTLQAGEKSGCPVHLTAHGTAGHASIPAPGNPIIKLAEAVRMVGENWLPIHPTKTVAAFLGVLAKDMGSHLGLTGQDIPWQQIPQLIESVIQDPFERAGLQAMIRNTAVPTILQAGVKRNVIPSIATAELDGRLLPGQTGDDLLRELCAVVSNGVEVTTSDYVMATESDPATPFAQVINQVVGSHLSGVQTIPFLLPGSTDARYLRPRGTIVYGFDPLLPGERIDLAHGVDERVSVKSLEFGLKVLDDVVKAIAVH